MSILVKKVCLLGNFAVGKTSLCQRFVNNVFSTDYHSTVGVNIVTKLVELEDIQVKLVIWDIAGELASIELLGNYLAGTQGCLLVADGTRQETLLQVDQMHDQLYQHNPAIVTGCLVNKSDLEEQWETPPQWLQERHEKGWNVQRSSALTGTGVDEAFTALAMRLVN